FLQDYSLPWTF
nr:immunoglobulin light chain junction region [Macaca mulatta]